MCTALPLSGFGQKARIIGGCLPGSSIVELAIQRRVQRPVVARCFLSSAYLLGQLGFAFPFFGKMAMTS